MRPNVYPFIPKAQEQSSSRMIPAGATRQANLAGVEPWEKSVQSYVADELKNGGPAHRRMEAKAVQFGAQARRGWLVCARHALQAQHLLPRSWPQFLGERKGKGKGVGEGSNLWRGREREGSNLLLRVVGIC